VLYWSFYDGAVIDSPAVLKGRGFSRAIRVQNGSGALERNQSKRALAKVV